MELTVMKDNVFLNEWLSQIHSKVSYVPDHILAEALEYIENKGIPGIKDEAYRNVPVESILKRYFRKLIKSDVISEPTQNIQYPNYIVLHPDKPFIHLKEKNIQIYTADNFPSKFQSLIGKESIHQKDFFAALNTAYCSNFTVIHITQSLEYPLYIEHSLNTPSNFQQQRILVIIDKNVNCTIIEKNESTIQQNTFYNFLGEVLVSEKANMNWISLQNNSNNQLYTISNYSFSIEQSSVLKHYQFSFNGALWRNNLNFHINQSEANVELKGLSIGKNQNIISQNTSILHNVGNSQSNQLYKNIADDKSTVLFNGFILVNKNAQKTNAYQNSKNLLLNDNATIFAKPQLEIYADDVKCSHGSSTGALNEDAMFYLQARGIDKSMAQKLLLQAFYSDIIESIENTDIKTYIQQQIII